MEPPVCRLHTYTLYPSRNNSCHLHIMRLEGCTYELRRQTWINKVRNTNGSWFDNYPCDTIMASGFLQCWTLDVGGRGTLFYMAYSISIYNFQDFNTSIGDIHNLVLISITRRLLNLHMWYYNLGVDMQVRKIDTIMLMWIPFWSWKQVWFPFAKAKDLLPFHACDFSYERWA
jgi:hypothetical protein